MRAGQRKTREIERKNPEHDCLGLEGRQAERQTETAREGEREGDRDRGKSDYLPHVVLGLGCAHHTDTATEPAIVHAAAQAPLVRFRIVHLDRLQVGGTVKAADGVQLTVHHR